MPKKTWTEEERKAFGERMKAIRDSKLVPKLEKPNVPRPPEMSVYRWNEHLRDSGLEVEV